MAKNKAATIDEFEARLLQDPKFRREYEAQAPTWDLGDALSALRRKRGLTQAQLADLIGVKREYIGRVETRPANLTLKSLAKIAAATGADFVIRFESGDVVLAEVKVPAASMQKNGTLDRFE